MLLWLLKVLCCVSVRGIFGHDLAKKKFNCCLLLPEKLTNETVLL